MNRRARDRLVIILVITGSMAVVGTLAWSVWRVYRLPSAQRTDAVGFGQFLLALVGAATAAIAAVVKRLTPTARRSTDEVAGGVQHRMSEAEAELRRVVPSEKYAEPAINYRARSRQLVDYLTGRFAGREKEIASLCAFLLQRQPGLRLLSADLGMGKSALVAQLVRRHELGESDLRDATVLFFFIRESGKDNSAVAYLKALVSQMLTALELPPRLYQDRDHLTQQYWDLWDMAAQRASKRRPLILLVDGLDEQADEQEKIRDLLPSASRPFVYVHVLVTTRPRPEATEDARPESPLHRAQMQGLGRLATSELMELLQQVTDAESARRMAPRLRELSKGEPLFARHLVDAVAAKGPGALWLVGTEAATATQGGRSYQSVRK